MAARLTAEQRAERLAFIEAQRAAGVTFKEIGAAIGKTAGATCTWYISTKRGPPKCVPTPLQEAVKNGPRMTRPCLKCERAFESMRADGAWLRMCPSCRSHSHITSPYSPDPGGGTGRQIQAQRRRGGA